MAEIDIIDQTLRDGQQSLWGMRMKVAHLADVADDIEHAGYRVVDLTGSSIFECMMRYNREDPWDGLDLVAHVDADVAAPLRVEEQLHRQVRPHPDSLMELWIRTLAKHGIDSFWIYDCLYNMDAMERLCRVVADVGCEVVPSIMYGISPVHTDDWFADRVREYVSWGITDAIYVEDAAGIMKPERAKTLMPALVEAAGDVPVEMQCHNTVGVAGMNYLIGVEAGVKVLHTAPGPMANGPSLPSTEQTIENLRWEGHTTRVDLDRVRRISAHMRRVAVQEGHPIGVAQRVQRVPVPPPTPRRHDRHAQGAARAVRHGGPVRGGPRGDRSRAGGPRTSDLGDTLLAADGHPVGAECRHWRALRIGARRGARLRARPSR